MSDFLPHPFWNFSLELYAGEGVAEACLDLQERRGCDVNILLFCCWLGASGRPTLTADRLRAHPEGERCLAGRDRAAACARCAGC